MTERLCANRRCRKSLEGRRAHARVCDKTCGTYARRDARRAQRAYEHPRCVVCSAPIDWGTKGFGKGALRLSTTTCSPKCSWTRSNWMREAA